MISEKLLRKLNIEVRRKYPEVLGVGIGLRRRRGRICRELVLKLFVEEKPTRGRPKPRDFKPLPAVWPVSIGSGVRKLEVRLPTDVETPMLVSPTSFGVGPMRAACWAFWRDAQGSEHLGVLTAGHGLPDPGELIEVEGAAGSGTVVLRSDPRADGIDVGLVEVAPPPALAAGFRNLPVGNASTLISLIGTETSDRLVTAGELWAGAAPTPIRLLGFMVRYPIKYPDGSVLVLRDVLLADGRNGTFAQGRSGATWVTNRPDPTGLAAAIQSYGRQPAFNLGVATHLDAALAWLSSQSIPIRDLRWR